MAESLANLQHRENIQTFKFDVTNVSVTTALGSGYMSQDINYDTGINLTGKKIFVSFVETSAYPVWAGGVKVVDNTKVAITYTRFSSGSISGTLYIMVTD